MTTKDGGPAFPCSNEQFTHGNPQTGDAWPGLSLRDWYAGQALIGLCQADMSDEEYIVSPHLLARTAYSMADAMLAARVAQP
jgi:hypothetical protein